VPRKSRRYQEVIFRPKDIEKCSCGAGEAWTQQEQQAAVKDGTRQLTRDDPAPQTIYRVSTTNNRALLVNLTRYSK
jgi:hypothetical protein